jgi:hypothetical protein
MRFIMERKIKKIRKVLAIIVAMLVISGCSTAYINKKGFRNYQPKNIGIVIGHDISAKTTMSTGEEFLYYFTPAWIAVGVAGTQAKEYCLEFQQQINDMVFERINGQMLEKGYDVSRLRTKGKEWDLFENFIDKKEIYPKMVKTYELEADAKRFDAILFFEYLLEGRLPGVLLERTKLETINVENMQLYQAKSKIFLYDTKTGKRLFFDSVQRGYSSSSKKTVSDALDTLVKLKFIPD